MYFHHINSDKEWCYHRAEGPAIKCANGNKE